jgi:hypothetical protein
MKIVVDKDANKIRFGRKQFSLHPYDPGDSGNRWRYKFLCEVCGDVEFAAIQHLTGSAIPDRIDFQTFATAREYPPAWAVNVFRRADKLHIGACCSFYYDKWDELVQLKEFYKTFTRLLKGLRRVLLDTEVDELSQAMFADVWMEFPLASPLSEGYEQIIKILRSKHEQTIKLLTAKVRRAVLAGSRSPPGKRERPAAFICHDSRDKERIARPIAEGLSRLACPVWYDEFSLDVGDHLRESIERGLKEAKKCILVLSPKFLANSGWTKVEFNSIFSRELIQRRNIILPVWAGVTTKGVLAYSPSLANRVAVNWRLGVDEVVRRLYCAIEDGASR